VPFAFRFVAMHWACEGGHIAIVQWLMSMGASSDLHATSESGRSPLFLACLNGHLKLAKYLHILGGEEQDVRRSDNYGKTPMHVACEQGHLHVCQWLWGAGAADDISKVDVSGRTALELACEGGHLGVCEWLYSVQKINGRGRNEKQEGGGRGAAHGAFAI
jgi:ankyrin repeat protein